jgi:hypothetical protein
MLVCEATLSIETFAQRRGITINDGVQAQTSSFKGCRTGGTKTPSMGDDTIGGMGEKPARIKRSKKATPTCHPPWHPTPNVKLSLRRKGEHRKTLIIALTGFRKQQHD